MIKEGWYIPEGADTQIRPRWVLGIKDKVVCYSRGGDQHFFCGENSFRDWVRKVKAMKPFNPPRVATVKITGRGDTKVMIIGESNGRYVMQAMPGDRFKLIGSAEYISGDMTAKLPKRAVIFA